MISRILVVLLFVALLTGCTGPGTSTPALPAETKSPDFSVAETLPSGTQPPVTELPVVTEMPTGTLADTQVPPVAPTPTDTPEQSGSPVLIAYIAPDGNLTLLEPDRGDGQPVTRDAAPFQPGQNPAQAEVTYSRPKWSSDGNQLAYLRQTGEPVESGFQYTISLVVYDLGSGESHSLVTAEQIPGFDWRPDSSLIAYALPVDQGYFTNQDASLATGINGVETDSGEIRKLVEPERGYPLVSPRWSPDGRFLAFEEVQSMEGRGQFVLYDIEAQDYLPWEQVIGNYSWSPDSQAIAFDRLAYIPSGEERIYLSDLTGENPQILSPETEPSYAFAPTFSPRGDRLAYLSAGEDPSSSMYKLFLVPVAGADPQELGTFDQPQEIVWLPDGNRLLIAVGPFDSMQIMEIKVKDGAARVLTGGSQPAVQPFYP